jgi:hypothetical protein
MAKRKKNPKSDYFFKNLMLVFLSNGCYRSTGTRKCLEKIYGQFHMINWLSLPSLLKLFSLRPRKHFEKYGAGENRK